MSIVALEHGKWRLQRGEFDTESQNNFFPSQVSVFPMNNEKRFCPNTRKAASALPKNNEKWICPNARKACEGKQNKRENLFCNLVCVVSIDAHALGKDVAYNARASH